MAGETQEPVRFSINQIKSSASGGFMPAPARILLSLTPHLLIEQRAYSFIIYHSSQQWATVLLIYSDLLALHARGETECQV
jgi:hypothetical protein